MSFSLLKADIEKRNDYLLNLNRLINDQECILKV